MTSHFYIVVPENCQDISTIFNNISTIFNNAQTLQILCFGSTVAYELGLVFILKLHRLLPYLAVSNNKLKLVSNWLRQD